MSDRPIQPARLLAAAAVAVALSVFPPATPAARAETAVGVRAGTPAPASS